MAAPERSRRDFIVPADRPLIGVLENDESVRYFTEEPETDATTADASVKRALSLLGAWADLDWAEPEAALDRIRHSSPPTPPLEL